MGDDVGHREKWRLALDMIDELISWGRRSPLVVADSGYGDAAEFRHGLATRGLAYVVQVTGGNLSGYPATAVRTAPAYTGYGLHPRPRYPSQRPPSPRWSPVSARTRPDECPGGTGPGIEAASPD